LQDAKKVPSAAAVRCLWGAESRSELSGDPRRPATISRRPCSCSSSVGFRYICSVGSLGRWP